MIRGSPVAKVLGMMMRVPVALIAIAVIASAVLLLTVSPSADAAEMSVAVDRGHLVRLVRQDCGSCHGMRLTGGLGTPLTREALAGKPVEALTSTILYGRAGTAMPAWKTLLSQGQAEWIADRLLEGFPEE